MKEIEKELKALANRRRLLIIKLLNERGKLAVGEIARQIKLSFKATSRHIRILRNSNIIDREQVGVQVFYGLALPSSKISQAVLNVL